MGILFGTNVSLNNRRFFDLVTGGHSSWHGRAHCRREGYDGQPMMSVKDGRGPGAGPEAPPLFVAE
jgi:hypothetical protein